MLQRLRFDKTLTLSELRAITYNTLTPDTNIRESNAHADASISWLLDDACIIKLDDGRYSYTPRGNDLICI